MVDGTSAGTIRQLMDPAGPVGVLPDPVKKPVYMSREQERLLKRMAQDEQVSEAEVRRRALEEYGRRHALNPLLDFGRAVSGWIPGRSGIPR